MIGLRLALSLLILPALGCLGVKRGDGGGGETPDGSVGDSGMVNPSGDVFIPEGCVRVSRVIDGDTFIYNKGAKEVRVRLYGINAKDDGEPCYETGRNALSSLIGGQIVRIDKDENGDETDDFGRELGYVSICGSAETGEVNLQMVEGGWACVFDRYVRGLKLEDALRVAEREAARKPAGCWKEYPGFCNLSDTR